MLVCLCMSCKTLHWRGCHGKQQHQHQRQHQHSHPRMALAYKYNTIQAGLQWCCVVDGWGCVLIGGSVFAGKCCRTMSSSSHYESPCLSPWLTLSLARHVVGIDLLAGLWRFVQRVMVAEVCEGPVTTISFVTLEVLIRTSVHTSIVCQFDVIAGQVAAA